MVQLPVSGAALVILLVAALATATYVRNNPIRGIDDPLCFPEGEYLCPDIRAATARDLKIGRYPQDTWWINATLMLGNSGAGPFEIHPRVPPGSTSVDQVTAFQALKHRFGGPDFFHEVGSIVFHPTHNHFHVAGTLTMHLAPPFNPLNPSLGPAYNNITADGRKVTFCLIDSENLRDGENSNNFDLRGAAYTQCQSATSIQGIAPGFADNYPYFLDGNGIKIYRDQHPTGLYYFIAEVNVDLRFKERATNSNKDQHNNNLAWRAIYLTWTVDGPTVTTVIPGFDREFTSDHARDEVGNNWPCLTARTTWYWPQTSGCRNCERGCCVKANPQDINSDSIVNIADMAQVLTSWSAGPTWSLADINGDGRVNAADLAFVITAWRTVFSTLPPTEGPRWPGKPTHAPTTPVPTIAPTVAPTFVTQAPTASNPTQAPSNSTVAPTQAPTASNSTAAPTRAPTAGNSTAAPTQAPTASNSTAAPTTR